MDEAPNIAIFCDFENVAIGVRDARYEAFSINLVLERLLDKGKIVVKKAYADWERYKSAKRPMHEAAFELIEIPHLSYSGKNSADIRMVVDALDLCYTKSHVDMFVVISGDSDFSPLVSKLRENNKQVIGMGVKNATSDLLMENCDEFIYYDDLIREKRKAGAKGGKGKPRSGKGSGRQAEGKRPAKKAAARPDKGGAKPDKSEPRPDAVEATPDQGTPAPDKAEGPPVKTEPGAETQADRQDSQEEAIELVLDTVESLFRDRDENLWASMVKQTLKRKRPGFSERFYGYRTFNQLLEDARKQGLLEIQKDDKSGGYLILAFGPNA